MIDETTKSKEVVRGARDGWGWFLRKEQPRRKGIENRAANLLEVVCPD